MNYSKKTVREGRLCILLLALAPAALAKPLTFAFRLSENGTNPFQRELWAEISSPKAQMVRVPVYYSGNGRFAARVNGEFKGTYRLNTLSEAQTGAEAILEPQMESPREIENSVPTSRPFVRRDPRNPRRFALSNGAPFVPLGTNLAWPDASGMAFYEKAFTSFAAADLNWARVWMSSWGGLNLDWLSEKRGPAPEIGQLDMAVAESWDWLLALAEDKGVYVQIVLQHHGQYSSATNPNWPQNPWNAANPGGFLESPADFFTSPQARALTKWKYRYIVARWGWSPAVMAWELFNEVHFTDAIRVAHNEAAVAAWHSEMSTYIRSLDTYHHLVTTSFENLRTAIYTSLDYYQPHLYAVNMLANPRVYELPPETLGAPIFYGEVGDDHMALSPEQKAAGVALAPLVWSSLFGTGDSPAQLWLGDQVLRTNRVGELGAIARFLKESALFERAGLVPFSPGVESTDRVPLTITAGQSWQHARPAHLKVPRDGQMPLELAEIPGIVAGAPKGIAEGFPDRMSFEINYDKPATVHLRAGNAAPAGAKLRVLVDAFPTAEYSWAPPTDLVAASPETAAEDRPRRIPSGPPRPIELSFNVPAGAHILTLENNGGPDWWEFRDIDFGVDVAALAAIGKRSSDFMALWVWHRTNVFALANGASASGSLGLQDVPPGTWRIRWLNTQSGESSPIQTVFHPGGRLLLATPPVVRSAAVFLVRDTASAVPPK